MNEKHKNVPRTAHAIPSDLRGCHSVVSQTKHALENQKPDERSLTQSIDKGILNIRVTRKSLHRALRIMEAIIRASESRGWRLKPRDDKSDSAIVIGDDAIGIRISERINRFEIPPEKPTDGWYWKRYRYEATGLLTLEITDYLGDSMRRSWSDGKRQRLKDVLEEFLAGIAAAGEALRKRRLELVEWKRQWKEKELERQHLEGRIMAERVRRDKLLEQSNWYQQAAVLRRLITAFSEQELPQFWTEEARSRWLNWAQRMAQRLDPFHNGYFGQDLAESKFESEMDCQPRGYL